MKISSFASSPTTPNPRSGATPVARTSTGRLIVEIGKDAFAYQDIQILETLTKHLGTLQEIYPTIKESFAHTLLKRFLPQANLLLLTPNQQQILGALKTKGFSIEELVSFEDGGGTALMAKFLDDKLMPCSNDMVSLVSTKDGFFSFVKNKSIYPSLSRFYKKFGFPAKPEGGEFYISYHELTEDAHQQIASLDKTDLPPAFPLPQGLLLGDGNTYSKLPKA
jgi:hypothetical protein